jgi:hypothetical protein
MDLSQNSNQKIKYLDDVLSVTSKNDF